MSTMDDRTEALGTIFGADWLARERAERSDERIKMTALRARLLAAARAAGAMTITARYEGGNDSGCVDEIHVEPQSADDALSMVSVEMTKPAYDDDARGFVDRPATVGFREAASDLFGWLVTEEHGNWWDGSSETSGEVVWHVGDDPDRIRGEHTVVTPHSETCGWSEGEGEDITLTDAADTAPGAATEG